MPSMKGGKFSPAQHNAMEAAAHGDSTLGIPKSVGQEYVDADAAQGHAGKAPRKKMNTEAMAKAVRGGMGGPMMRGTKGVP